MNKRRSLNRSSLLPKAAFRYVALYFLYTLAKSDVDYLVLWGNASFDLFLSVRMGLQSMDISALTEVFQCHLRNATNVSNCSFPSDISIDSGWRLTPQATGIPKVAAEDTSIVAGNDRGEKKAIPILKGTGIFIDIIGTHYNRTYLVFSLMFGLYKNFTKQNIFSARYWDDPHTFKPSRFLKDWPRDAFVPFSAGERWFTLVKMFFYHYRNM